MAYPLNGVKPKNYKIRRPTKMQFVRVDAKSPLNFAFDDGTRFVPLGGNIPWLRSPEDSLEQR